MSLNINMQGDGTHAGVRKPWVGGHSPKCVCSKCVCPRGCTDTCLTAVTGRSYPNCKEAKS